MCDCLDFKNPSYAIRTLRPETRVSARIPDSAGRPNNATLVTEAGMYALIMNGRKQIAKNFQHWVCSEVLPIIRKTGSYSVGVKRKREEDESQERSLAIRERTIKCLQTEMEIMRSLGPLEDRAVVFYRSQMTQLAPLGSPAIAAGDAGAVVVPGITSGHISLSTWMTDNGLSAYARDTGLMIVIGQNVSKAYKAKHGHLPPKHLQQILGGSTRKVNTLYGQDYVDFGHVIHQTCAKGKK